MLAEPEDTEETGWYSGRVYCHGCGNEHISTWPTGAPEGQFECPHCGAEQSTVISTTLTEEWAAKIQPGGRG